MYEYFVILKGTNKNLAILEFKTLFLTCFNEEIELIQKENKIYYCNTKNEIKNNKFLKRLTYTTSIINIIKEYKDYNDFKNNITGIKKFENLPFIVRKIKPQKKDKFNLSEKELAKPIWTSLKNPKVSTNNYKIEYNFIFLNNTNNFYFGYKIFENKKEYLDRMPKKRPIKMPYTLKSDMARCAINLLGIKQGIILDPFAGIGGILLEAVDMGFKIIANDISKNDIILLKKNLKYYFPDLEYKIFNKDIKYQFLEENSVDAIVTDIPYGRCSRKLGEDIYENFLKNAKKILKPKSKMIVIYSNFVDFEKYALKYFKYINKEKEYMNSSMTRYILILENDK